MPYPLHFYITFSLFSGYTLVYFLYMPLSQDIFSDFYGLLVCFYGLLVCFYGLLVILELFSSICPIHSTSISHFPLFWVYTCLFSLYTHFSRHILWFPRYYWSNWGFFPLYALSTPLLYHIFLLFWVYTCLFSLYAHFSRHVLWFLWIIGHTGAFFLYMPIPHIPFCFYSLFLEEQTNLYLLHFIRKPEKTVQYKL